MLPKIGVGDTTHEHGLALGRAHKVEKGREDTAEVGYTGYNRRINPNCSEEPNSYCFYAHRR